MLHFRTPIEQYEHHWEYAASEAALRAQVGETPKKGRKTLWKIALVILALLAALTAILI